jgi:hypothetical protein
MAIDKTFQHTKDSGITIAFIPSQFLKVVLSSTIVEPCADSYDFISDKAVLVSPLSLTFYVRFSALKPSPPVYHFAIKSRL